MKRVLRGRVESGKHDASRWLERFREPYRTKTGMAIVPGSLNLRLDEAFDWFDPELVGRVVRFGREEYGGERDILLLPCVLPSLGRRRAFLWSTTTAARERPDLRLVEVIADVRLREAHGLADGDQVEVELGE